MAISRVDQVRPGTITPADQVEKQQKVQERVELFKTEAYEKAPSVSLQSGDTLRLGCSTGENEAKELQALLSGLSTDQSQAPMGSVGKLVDAVKAEAKKGDMSPEGLSTSASALSASSGEAISTTLNTLGLDHGSHGTAVSTVTALGLGEAEGQLFELATAVKNKQATATELRATMTDLRDMITDDVWPQDFEYDSVTFDTEGNMSVETITVSLDSKEEANSLLQRLDGSMASLKDITELQQVDLQQTMQDQQRIMNMFSALLETIHKTQQAMIHNLKA